MLPKLLIVGQLPPPFHGSNVMTKTFLSSLERLGYTVSIAEKTFSKTMDEVEKFSLKKLVRAQMVIFRIIRSFVTTKADLCFYFISLKPPSFYIDVLFIFLLRLLGTSTVLYIHGKGFRKFSQRSSLMRWLLRSPILSDLLGALVLGERLKQDIDFFIPNDRIFILPNCIPDDSPKVMNAFVKRRTNDEIRILYLSNLVPEKGPIEFIKMARLVADSGKPVKFVLAGATSSSSFQRKIEHLISDLNLFDDIEMVGAVYGPAKEKLFQDSDIFVFPSYYHLEAFPLVNLEAMRAGLPVVSSNEGSIPEAVIHGTNGFIVDPRNVEQLSDRVLKLVNNVELRTEMGEAGKKMFEEFFTTQAYEKRLHDGINFFLGLAGLNTLRENTIRQHISLKNHHCPK
jgi:glycosyltransferase involved in cell wall biosynthesis